MTPGELIAAGWALVPVPAGSKAAQGRWNVTDYGATAFGLSGAVEVTFPGDDTIRLTFRDGRVYTMRLGSDDEAYHFVNDADPADVLRFPVEDADGEAEGA